MIARTVRPGDWAGPTAKNGEARAHRHTPAMPTGAYRYRRRWRAVLTSTVEDSEP